MDKYAERIRVSEEEFERSVMKEGKEPLQELRTICPDPSVREPLTKDPLCLFYNSCDLLPVVRYSALDVETAWLVLQDTVDPRLICRAGLRVQIEEPGISTPRI